MDRNVLQGLWLPRDDLIGWKVEFSDGRAFTHEQPGPLAEAEVELDANGCLSSGSLGLARPRPAFFPAFTFSAHLSLLSRSRGWVPVGQGFIPPARQDGEEEWTLELRPLEDLTLDGYHDGSVAHNTLGGEPAEWTETNRTVIERALKRSPTASVGVDWAGRMILARPEDGSPVHVSRANFHAWKALPDVVLPYLTAARWDGGRGWKKGEYHGVSRPPLTPQRVQDAGEVKFEEVTRAKGPPVIESREIIIDPLTVDGSPPAPHPRSATLGQERSTVTARYYAHVQVLDFQSWYEGSALVGQESELVKSLQKEVETLQGAYALAVSTLGPDAPLSVEEGRKLQGAQNMLRLAQVEGRNAGEGSDYEPLSARLSLGLVWDRSWLFSDRYDAPNWMEDEQPASAQYRGAAHAGYAVPMGGEGAAYLTTGLTMWLSKLPWDEEALAFEHPEADEAGNELAQADVIRPELSPHTLKVFDTQVQEYEVTRQAAFTVGNLTIPSEYFRGAVAPGLAKLMDRAWREQYDPDEPPEGEKPPSEAWDGRWFMHVAVWWRMAAGGEGRALSNDAFGIRVPYATVTRWNGEPLFGTKVLTPPPPPEQLSWPTTWGPNAEGEISGALLPPALVDGVPVAGSRFKLSPGDLSSTVAVGILPFKEGGPD